MRDKIAVFSLRKLVFLEIVINAESHARVDAQREANRRHVRLNFRRFVSRAGKRLVGKFARNRAQALDARELEGAQGAPLHAISQQIPRAAFEPQADGADLARRAVSAAVVIIKGERLAV